MTPAIRSLSTLALGACTLVALAGCDTLALLAGFPAPTIAVSQPLPVALDYREGPGGIVMLSGRVNDRADVEFVLDTGAPVTVFIDGPATAPLAFDTSKARRLGPSDDPAAPIGALARDLALAFGPVALAGVTAVVLPEAALACPERYRRMGFAGVIGADLFRRFVVEVDPGEQRVRLHEPAGWRVPDGASVVPLVMENGHPYARAVLALPSGARVERHVHVDTGMNRALTLVGGDAAAALPLPADGEVTRTCFVGGLRELRAGAPLDLQLGGVTVARVRPDYAKPGETTSAQANGAIGAALLAGWRYAVDYPGRRLVLIERLPARAS
jgi:hypothetical protein